MIRAFLLTLFFTLAIYPESEKISWANEEGSLDWKSALDKCKSNGMRLPTKKELLSVYKSREIKKWYWTSDELDSERAWIVVLNVGDTVHIPKQYHNYVRCIR